MTKARSLFFYDLETSGFSPREARIMQFAGQRTDMNLKPIGEPHNYLIKMNEDVLPEPDAVLLTGITPQATIAEGLTEAEFLKIFSNEISTEGTVFVGFNSIRFDDEFMRFLHYRNFYDAYEWHWLEGRGRWDLLDVVRMTRALRPDGIKWPFDSTGKAANRLELLASINGLLHETAHDALSDVQATIALAKLIQTKQPKLFNYLLEHRDKKMVAKVVLANQPFVYTSGKYDAEHEKTTVVSTLCEHPKKSGALVYDLRYDPTPYLHMKAKELAKIWHHYCKERPCPHQRLPVKTLQFNRCPAVAPLGVFDAASQKRLQLPLPIIQKHLAMLQKQPAFTQEVLEALTFLDKEQQAKFALGDLEPDERLYDDFISDTDKTAMNAVRNADIKDISTFEPKFTDQRLKNLLPLYKARNFPKEMTDEDQIYWQNFCKRRLMEGKPSRAERFFARLGELAESKGLSGQKQYLLEELQLYGQSIMPVEE